MPVTDLRRRSPSPISVTDLQPGPLVANVVSETGTPSNDQGRKPKLHG